MPIDPRIPLMGQQVQTPGPLEMYGSLMGLKAQQQQMQARQQAMQQEAEAHQVRTAGSIQQIQGQEQANQIQSAAADAIARIKGGNAEEVLSTLHPIVRQAAEKWLGEQEGFQNKRKALLLEDLKHSAAFVRDMNYDPQVMEVVFGLKAADIPDVAQVWEQNKDNPEALKRVIDHYAGPAPEKKGAYTLRPGDERRGPDDELLANAPFAPKEPKEVKGKWADDYDANGKPISVWVPEGPGAIAPRTEPVQPPQRPTVLAPGARAIGPNGELIAEGAPIERAPQSQRPLILSPGARAVGVNGELIAEGAPIERSPQFQRPTVLAPGSLAIDSTGATIAEGRPIEGPVTRPRVVDPLSREAYAIAFAKKLHKRPDELNDAEIRMASQEYERAKDKPETAAQKEAKREWVMRGGKPVRVTEDQIQPGDEPYGRNAGLGTKNVTSGDAGRLTEFDTSLDDVRTLRGVLTSKSAAAQTGFAAKLGAGLWNPITEYTGIGAEAKAKQATIDRVKQVIGKALEGGVLRKEDELKYEKILPTIGDPPSVVEAKLKGLDSAITQRRERLLENLESAGYDTSKFKKVGGGAPSAPSAGGIPSYDEYLKSRKK